ncbi:metallophosphoesterase [Simkania negevensis]|uniref:Metallophosphoesterase n=1 Tax=Simkania negevensis TaxID=83561 RepID=A0ABS3ARK9_9BACT|nr:metallophosphoesterase [Simkania negevensis]
MKEKFVKGPGVLRLAHLSDIHFGHITLSPSQFLSKRWLGNLNLLLHRRYIYQYDAVYQLPLLLREYDVDLVCISGDLTTTALEQEYSIAAEFVRMLEAEGMTVLLIPGNHDHYTREAFKSKLFYQYFHIPQNKIDASLPHYSLKEDRICCTQLNEIWWWIGLDTTLSTPLLSAFGLFSDELAERLHAVLEAIPDQAHVVVANHYPIISHAPKSRQLRNSEKLEKVLLEHPQVKIYLHGHEHQHRIIDCRNQHRFYQLNSGSCSHDTQGAFHLVDLMPHQCRALVFRWKKLSENESKEWMPFHQVDLPWR